MEVLLRAADFAERLLVEETGLTWPQVDALLAVDRLGTPTMGEVGRETHRACSTMTVLIDNLEKLDMLERFRDKQDRRVIRLRITKPGVMANLKRALAEYTENIPAPVRQWCAELVSGKAAQLAG